jgi:hypothetical protein
MEVKRMSSDIAMLVTGVMIMVGAIMAGGAIYAGLEKIADAINAQGKVSE